MPREKDEMIIIVNQIKKLQWDDWRMNLVFQHKYFSVKFNI